MKDNQLHIISKVNHQINKEYSLTKLPSILHESILNWETEQRKRGDKFFLGYEELSALLNIHPQTLRKYTNISQPKYPAVNHLIAMCRIMNDYTAWEYLSGEIK